VPGYFPSFSGSLPADLLIYAPLVAAARKRKFNDMGAKNFLCIFSRVLAHTKRQAATLADLACLATALIDALLFPIRSPARTIGLGHDSPEIALGMNKRHGSSAIALAISRWWDGVLQQTLMQGRSFKHLAIHKKHVMSSMSSGTLLFT
jgi:hypothetical protein